MGIDWYVVNKRDATFFELGRGGWYGLNHEREEFTDAEYLAHQIFDTTCVAGMTEDDPDSRAWVAGLATELVAFAAGAPKADLCIITDNSDDLSLIRALGYRCVGTRYGTTPEERLENIREQNERSARRRIDWESWRGHPDFEGFDRGRHSNKMRRHIIPIPNGLAQVDEYLKEIDKDKA